MKTKKECKTIKDTYDTSRILVELFEKYKNYDSTMFEHYNPDELFANRRKKIENLTNNGGIAIIEYKESIFKRILNKIKSIFDILKR